MTVTVGRRALSLLVAVLAALLVLPPAGHGATPAAARGAAVVQVAGGHDQVAVATAPVAHSAVTGHPLPALPADTDAPAALLRSRVADEAVGATHSAARAPGAARAPPLTA